MSSILLGLLGAALLKVAFNIVDAPRNPAWVWIIAGLLGMLAAFLIIQAMVLMLGGEWLIRRY